MTNNNNLLKCQFCNKRYIDLLIEHLEICQSPQRHQILFGSDGQTIKLNFPQLFCDSCDQSFLKISNDHDLWCSLLCFIDEKIK